MVTVSDVTRWPAYVRCRMTPCAVARPAAAPPPLRGVRRGVGLLPYTPILAHLAYSWHTLGSLWAHLARIAHLAHSWLNHGSLDSLGSHGSIWAHSADLADLTDLAHSCLILGSLGSFEFTWLTLGSPLAHSWTTLDSHVSLLGSLCSHCSLGSRG